MSRFRPVHGLVLVCLLVLPVVGWALARELFPERFTGHQRVTPDQRGEVRLDLAGLGRGEVRFFRYLNPGNQEVRFFVGRDEAGVVQVAFDANELCYKTKRGYQYQDGWLVCRKCDKAFRLAEVNAGTGGCQPVPLAHRLEGDTLVLAEDDILAGWRYFR
jgi:uncharacterized membrane protein